MHSKPQSVFIHAKRHEQRPNRWILAAVMHRKLNMLNLPCKNGQDYPARLHTSPYVILQLVRHLARCCTQDVARYLTHSIISCS